MSVNGITGSVATSAAEAYTYTPANKVVESDKKATADVNAKSTSASEGVVYQHSTDAESEKKAAAETKTYKQDTGMISKLKADAEARTAQLQDIVNKLINKQGMTFDIANGSNLKSMFEGIEVDAETKAQAQKDIAEDGYWGVKQTSERIFDFAKALTGGDPDKMKDMREAFEKGFKQATSAWGDDLPEISQQTYGAVQKLFDDYENEINGGGTATA
ncbi:MAG: hypothetical protein K6E50_03575 [Lachnospiraceae bacterium]|nr:hypothetical protein [Lachnospiraceae bacterium]